MSTINQFITDKLNNVSMKIGETVSTIIGNKTIESVNEENDTDGSSQIILTFTYKSKLPLSCCKKITQILEP